MKPQPTVSLVFSFGGPVHQRRKLTGLSGIGLAGVAMSPNVRVRGRVSTTLRVTIRTTSAVTVPWRRISNAGRSAARLQSRSFSANQAIPRSGPPSQIYGTKGPGNCQRPTWRESQTFPLASGSPVFV